MARYDLNPAAQRVRDRMEIPVLIAALAVIPVVFVEERVTSPTWLIVAAIANWIIWFAFLAEYVAVVRLVEDKWRYTRRAWFSVFIIVVSFPGWPALLAATRLGRLTRLARVLRILRLARLATALTRGSMALRRIFRRAALAYAVAMAGLLALGFGTVISMIEESVTSPLDGIWWAFATLMTVGYGDIAPATPLGRGVAVVLMVLGISVIALITASVAARFVEEDEEAIADEVARLHSRLDDIEVLLRSALDQPPGPGFVRPRMRSLTAQEAAAKQIA